MWGEALLKLEKVFKKKFPDAKVEIGKEKRPASSKDYPFIYLIPAELKYDYEKFTLAIAVYFGIVAKEESEKDGTLAFLSFLHDITMTVFEENISPFVFEPSAYAMKDFTKNHPYYEGEVQIFVSFPYQTAQLNERDF